MKRMLIHGQTVILGDCLDGMSKLAAHSIDVILTSPPYNIGIGYSSYQDKRDYQDYLSWMAKVSNQSKRLLKPDGHIFLNLMAVSKYPWLSHDVAVEFRKHFHLQNRIVWAKHVAIIDNKTHLGTYTPMSSEHFLTFSSEDVWHFTNSGRVPIDKRNGGLKIEHRSDPRIKHDYRDLGNVWFIPSRKSSNNPVKEHPATFPIELPMSCLNMVKGSNLTVLDPFCGSGTTLLACSQLGHHGVGFEIDPDYCKLAANRIKKHNRTVFPSIKNTPMHKNWII